MNTSALSLSDIAARIKAADAIWIFTHRRPDGDAIGSAYGLKYGIEARFPDKTVEVYCADPIPDRLRFLVFDDEETLYERADGTRAELCISVDIASHKLFGDIEPDFIDDIDIKIDHHESGDDFAPAAYVDPTAAATGEIIFDLLPLLGACPDGQTAQMANTALYGAISSDTGGFRYSNTTPNTLRIAASLLEAGVNGAAVAHCLYESKSKEEIRAIQVAYEKMTYHADGMIAMTVLTQNDLKRYHIDEDALGVVSALPREIAGVELGIVLRQSPKYPDVYKISMRSSERVDVSALCGRFGGGGHVRAAGGEIRAASENDACKAVLDAALAVIDG